LICGGAPSVLDITELEENVKAAMNRAYGSKQYTRICALFITWDWSGIPPTAEDETDELEVLLSRQYGFETRTLRLPASKPNLGETPDLEVTRDLLATSWLLFALSDVFETYGGSNTLFIVHYRGQARLEDRFYNGEMLDLEYMLR